MIAAETRSGMSDSQETENRRHEFPKMEGKGCEYMDFLRYLIGLVTLFLFLAVAALIVWYCMFGSVRQTEPGGTLVKQAWEVVL